MSQQTVGSARQDRQIARTTAAIAAVYAASKADMLARVRLGHLYDALRSVWADRLTAVLAEHGKDVATDVGTAAAQKYGVETFDAARLNGWLEAGAKARAEGWQQGIEQMLQSINLSAPDIEAEVNRAIDDAVSPEKAEAEAEDLVKSSANFGDIEAARAAGRTTKTWHHVPGEKTSRAEHAAMDGQTVPIDERFSNMLRFPRSPGPPSEVAGCRCYLTYGGDGA